jgi:hypothetical protein
VRPTKVARGPIRIGRKGSGGAPLVVGGSTRTTGERIPDHELLVLVHPSVEGRLLLAMSLECVAVAPQPEESHYPEPPPKAATAAIRTTIFTTRMVCVHRSGVLKAWVAARQLGVFARTVQRVLTACGGAGSREVEAQIDPLVPSVSREHEQRIRLGHYRAR